MQKLKTGTKAICLLIVGVLAGNFLFVLWYRSVINKGLLVRGNDQLSYKTLRLKQPGLFKHMAINGNLMTEGPADLAQINWRPRFVIDLDAKEPSIEIPAEFAPIFNAEVRSDTLFIKFFSPVDLKDTEFNEYGKYNDRKLVKINLPGPASLTGLNARLYLSKASSKTKEMQVSLAKSTLRVGEVDLDLLNIKAGELSKLRTDSGCHIKTLTCDLRNSNIYLYPRTVSSIGQKKMDKLSSIGIINNLGLIDPITDKPNAAD